MFDNDVFLLIWILVLLFFVRLHTKKEGSDRPEGVEPQLNKSEPETMPSKDLTDKVCQLELKQLKEEFEHFKQNQTKLLLNTSNDAGAESSERDSLKLKNSELQEQIQELKMKNVTQSRELKVLLRNLQQEFTKAEERNQLDLENCQELCQQKLEELQHEPEILEYKGAPVLPTPTEKHFDIEDSEFFNRLLTSPSGLGLGTSLDLPYDSQGHLLSSQNPCQPSQLSAEDNHQSEKESLRENAFLDFLNQNTWREAEMTKLKVEKSNLQSALQECQLSEVKLLEKVHDLQEEIGKLERDKSRESANVEYIKNVVLKFMLTESHSVKQQLTSAIGSVLLFSPSELSQVRKIQNSGLWQS